MDSLEAIQDRSEAVLAHNRLHGVTVPNRDIFPKQFSWDTAIIAEGIATLDPYQAAHEIQTMLSSMWRNGMLPNEARISDEPDVSEKYIFRTAKHPQKPKGYQTSGIVQPPLLTAAALEVGKRLPTQDRIEFYKSIFHPLKKHHQYLLNQRVVNDDGLVALMHPYESGMDNTPPWRETLFIAYSAQHETAWGALKEQLGKFAISGYRHFLGDLKEISIQERSDNDDVITSFYQTRKISGYGYDMAKIIEDPAIPLIEDVGFNAVLDAANSALVEISDDLFDPLFQIDIDLRIKMARLHTAIETKLWHEDPQKPHESGYYSRDARTGQLILLPTIASLYPLATDIAEDRQKHLLGTLSDINKFNTKNPFPSVPIDSDHFHPTAYWRGVAWPFPRYIIEKGLMRIDHIDLAQEIGLRILGRSAEKEKSEYENPLSGTPLGCRNFSPTAALDLLLCEIL